MKNNQGTIKDANRYWNFFKMIIGALIEAATTELIKLTVIASQNTTISNSDCDAKKTGKSIIPNEIIMSTY